MNKNILAVLIPFAAVAGSVIGFVWWDRGAPPGFNPTPHPVSVTDVTRAHRGVQIRGTAPDRLPQELVLGRLLFLLD